MTYTQLAAGFPREGGLSPVVTVEWTPGGDTMRLRIRIAEDSGPLIDFERPVVAGELEPNDAVRLLILALPCGVLEPTLEQLVRRVWDLADNGGIWWLPTSALPGSTRALLGA